MDKITVRSFFDNVLATSRASSELKKRIEQDIIVGDDGFFVYWPVGERGGYLNEYHLVLIAAMLNNKNIAWEDDIDNYFDSQA